MAIRSLISVRGGSRRRRVVPKEEEEGEGEGEEGEELRVGGGHAVAFSVHLCAESEPLLEISRPHKLDLRRTRAPL